MTEMIKLKCQSLIPPEQIERSDRDVASLAGLPDGSATSLSKKQSTQPDPDSYLNQNHPPAAHRVGCTV